MKNQDMFIAIRAARLAGELILKAYGSVKNIGIKDGKGIVTEIDKQSELLIKNLLSKTGYGFLGEESETNYLTEKLWIVDPLDGTSNFVSNISNFCVSIALMIKGSVVLGVIYNPVEEQLFYAVRGKGAYLNEKPIHVSKNKFSINSLVLTTHGYAQKDRELYSKVVDRLVKSCMLRKLGSTALDLCRVARGSADAFVGFGDEIWDYGAGLLIVEEAKSKVTDWNGETKRDNNYFILASSYNCNKFLKRQLKNLQY